MKVILKENVDSLGKVGETVKVSDGYARNFLIPKGLAVEASSKNAKSVEDERRRILQKAEKDRRKAQSMADRLAGVTFVVRRRVGEQEKLFGSVNTKDIEQCAVDMGVELERKWILLEEPIRELGTFPVKIRLPGGVNAEITVSVEAEMES
ncbi:MAG: 50S ribosomal protein L9 [Syntrophaceae bacterium]|nr:50S ribosomal protein L9 [Syntrophaceae bacterium]